MSCGECVALVGANGTGKTTLLRVLSGSLPFSSGAVWIHGTALGRCRHSVAYLSQRSAADWTFPTTVADVVLAGRYAHLGWFSRPKPRDRDIAARALESVGLLDMAGRAPGALSGGQLQRMLLARALAQEADLLLLDEPFNALDEASRAGLADTIHRLASRGTTFIIATHGDSHDGVNYGYRLVVGATGSVSLLMAGEDAS